MLHYPNFNEERQPDALNPLQVIILSAMSGDAIEYTITLESDDTIAMLRQRLQHRIYVRQQKGIRIQFLRDGRLLKDDDLVKPSSHATGPIVLTRMNEDVATCYCGNKKRVDTCFCAACGIFVCDDCSSSQEDIYCGVCKKYCCAQCVRKRCANAAWSFCSRCGRQKCTVCVRLGLDEPCRGCPGNH